MDVLAIDNAELSWFDYYINTGASQDAGRQASGMSVLHDYLRLNMIK